MDATRTNLRGIAALAAVAAVWAVVLSMHAFVPRPQVAIAGAFDLVVTAGAVMWFVAVRGGYLPRRALWIVVALGAIAARILLAEGATHATLAAGAAIEGCVLVVIGIRIRRARRGWRLARLAGAPRIDALHEALAATGLPKGVTGVLATELAIVGSAVTGWRRP